MATLPRRLDDAPMALEMRIAREQRDLHWPSRLCEGLGQRLAWLKCCPCEPLTQPRRPVSREVGAAWPDQRPAFERSAPEQHAETHLVAVGEGELDRPGAVAEHHAGRDNITTLHLAAGIAHSALVDGLRLAFDLHRARPLDGMDLKPYPE